MFETGRFFSHILTNEGKECLGSEASPDVVEGLTTQSERGRVGLDKSQPKIDSMCEKKRPVSNMSPEVAQLQLCGTRSKTGF